MVSPGFLNLTLAAISPDLVRAWEKELQPYPEVKVCQSDLFLLRADAVVSPANSFGNMDGGLDGKLRDFFGREVEDRDFEAYIREESDDLPEDLEAR